MKRLTPKQKQLKTRRLLKDAARLLTGTVIAFAYTMLFIRGENDAFITISVNAVIAAIIIGSIVKTRWSRHQERKRRRLNYYYKLKREGRI